ncbi:MAG: hypothetical protein ACK4N5_03540 [Myxococcales bacterium]
MRLVPVIPIRNAALWMMFGVLTLAPSLAFAAPTKVGVLVARVSTKGTEVDPQLKQFADEFKTAMVASSFKVVEAKTFTLDEGGTGTISLPGGKKVDVKLVSRKPDGSITVKVDVPPLTLTPELKPNAYIPLDAGTHGDGKLFVLVRNG